MRDEQDNWNGIEHKCPCCGYEVELDWDKDWKTPKKERFIKGDESFIKIESGGRYADFETDRKKDIYWGRQEYETAYLLGCPKCSCVSFKFV